MLWLWICLVGQSRSYKGRSVNSTQGPFRRPSDSIHLPLLKAWIDDCDLKGCNDHNVGKVILSADAVLFPNSIILQRSRWHKVLPMLLIPNPHHDDHCRLILYGTYEGRIHNNIKLQVPFTKWCCGSGSSHGWQLATIEDQTERSAYSTQEPFQQTSPLVLLPPIIKVCLDITHPTMTITSIRLSYQLIPE